MKIVTEPLDRWKYHVDTSARNEYGDIVVAHEIYDPETGTVCYRCQEQYWKHDFKRWCDSYREDKTQPEPMSPGHCMFLRPLSYGRLPVGETRQNMIRLAIRRRIVGNLHGWDRELRKDITGLRQLARIVKATVNAKMNDQDTGAAHYLACILS